MPWAVRRAGWLLIGGLLALAGCAGGGGRAISHRPVVDGTPRVGLPYQVGGLTYTPADDERYDMIGIASWYGDEFRGRPTANGEAFDPDAITGAHPTLPIPSYVEVTALDTGRIILVRINDRGPFARGRIIDLSHGAARLLGYAREGSTRVRVRRVYPSEADKTALRAGRAAAERLPAPPQLLSGLRARASGGQAAMAAPAAAFQGRSTEAAAGAPPAVTTASLIPSAAFVGDTYVQVAALSDRARADSLAQRLAEIGPATVQPAGAIFRVRLGPLRGEEVARVLAEAKRRGYQEARIVR